MRRPRTPAQPEAGAVGPKLPPPPVSTDFPFEVRHVEVNGLDVAHVSVGSGDPVVFVHGNPTSSHLWRNILPIVGQHHRAIALDLPGMGRSAKPRQPLRYVDQVDAFGRFIEALDLSNVVLVGHDWGAPIVFDHARLNPDRVRGIAFMEGVLPPTFPQPSFEAMGPDIGGMFRTFKDPVKGRELVVDQNFFIERLLPQFVDRPMTDADLDPYRRPFLRPADREVVLMWPREVPIAGEPPDVVARMQSIEKFMRETAMPVLLLYGDPGVVLPVEGVAWYVENVRRIETAYVGRGLHFLQEDHPQAIGRAINDWLRRT